MGRNPQRRSKKILIDHPEWQIIGFYLSGSTRNRIIIDANSSNLNLNFLEFDIDNLHVTINRINEKLLRYNPKIKEQFETL